MAYADYDFYKTSYYGSVVLDSDFPRLAERASDFIDLVTSDKLVDGLPSSLAELMYQLELAEKNATSYATMNGTSVSTRPGEYGLVTDDDGNIRLVHTASAVNNNDNTGIVTSKSSGSESISYATPQQICAGAKEWSAIYAAAGDVKKTNDLLLKKALPLLMGVRTDEGIPILYAGFQG